MRLKTVFFIIAAIVLLLFVFNVSWAGDKKHMPPTTVKNYYNDTTNTEEQNQKQTQGQHQKQEQVNTQTQGNEQSITFTSPDDIKIKNTPNPDAPAIYAQNPCALAWSASATVAGFGASGGKAYIDEKCNARAWATLMFQMGARDAAIYLMCMQPEAAGVPDCQGVQDYNKELQLVSLGHDKLVEENTELRERIVFILSERDADKQRCDESVNRVGSELESCLQK